MRGRHTLFFTGRLLFPALLLPSDLFYPAPSLPSSLPFFLSNVLITVLFTKHLRKIKYIPITFRPRQGGVNSINLKRIFKIGQQALKDFRTINEQIKDIG